MADRFEGERFNALMALAEHRRELRADRMGREWQVTVPLWALLAGVIAKPDVLPARWMTVAAAVSVGVALWVWTLWHWLEARKDARGMRILHDKAFELALPGEPNPFKPKIKAGAESEARRSWRDAMTEGLLWAKLGVALVLTIGAVTVALVAPAAETAFKVELDH